MGDRIKVLIVDDSITYRNILEKAINAHPHANVIAKAANGKIAMRKLEAEKPDLVLLDVMMPEMDGVETLKAIKKDYSDVEAIMISAFDMKNAKGTIQSLQLGALDFLQKPTVTNAAEGLSILIKQLGALIDVITKKQNRTFKSVPASAPVVTDAVTSKGISASSNFDMVVVGVSTGGPNALHQVIGDLSNDIKAPILIVQHMPSMFTESLAESLNKITGLTVKEAKHNEPVLDSHIYIAPGGKHMVLENRNFPPKPFIMIHEKPPVNNCRPSVDVLFDSVAELKPNNLLSLVMTGMGRDGLNGVKSLKKYNTPCIIQDEQSSVVWGMPGVIHDAGAYDEMLDLKKIGARISELVAKK